MPIVFTPLSSVANRTEPNWLVGEAQYAAEHAAAVDKQCSNKVVKIEGEPYYIYDNYKNFTEQEVCVYDTGSFQYAFYERYYDYGMMGGIERGIAVLFGAHTNFIPVAGLGNIFMVDELYLGQSTAYVVYDTNDYSLSVYKDIVQHITKRDDGIWLVDGNPDFRYTDAYGSKLPVAGIGLSHNKQWLSFGVANFGITTLNLDTFQLNRVSDRYNITGHTWPSPSLHTSVSDDGEYVVVGGFGYQTEVIVVRECGRSDLAANMGVFQSELLGDRNCPYRDLTQLVWDRSQETATGEHIMDKLHINSSGSMFTYWDEYRWSAIYAPNYLQPGQLYYLALGDSFASGEGDITLDGADHYLSGTNIYGNYNKGIPRETCHISSRSYSMRIAEGMQLTRGADMQSVACSGAVISDILRSGMKSSGYVDTNYLGQSTQLISQNGARLTGISNASQLQDDARSSYAPGRVQQIEFVRKAQPKYMTVMIGGNDIDFAGVMMACAQNSLPSADETCDYAQGEGLAGEAKKVHDLYPRLVDFYKALHEVSPATVIYAIGYPQFMDESNESCAEMLSLYSRSERKAIHDLIAYANAIIRNAALDAGVKYIDVSDALADGQLCGSGRAMTGITDVLATMIYTEYMKSLTMSDSVIAKYLNLFPSGNLHKMALQMYAAERSAMLIGQYFYSPATTLADISQELSHPNAIGHDAIYAAIKEGLGDDLLESTSCNRRVSCPDGTLKGWPEVGDYVPGVAIKGNTVYVSGNGQVTVGHTGASGKVTIGALVKSLAGQFIRIAAGVVNGTVDPSQPLTVEIHSQPTVLGMMTRVGDEYVLNTSLPQDIPVGQHVLHIKGKLLDGQSFDMDAPVFIEGPVGDIDDDGIADSSDTCAFGQPRGLDVDNDGIDDACDLSVMPTPPERNQVQALGGRSDQAAGEVSSLEQSLAVRSVYDPCDRCAVFASDKARTPSPTNAANNKRSENILMWLVSIGLLLAISGALLFYKRRHAKSKK